MENNLREILNKNNIKFNKITLKNTVKIINDNKNKLVIKKDTKNLDNTYNYLLSRSFDYFPRIVKKEKDYNIYEYSLTRSCFRTSLCSLLFTICGFFNLRAFVAIHADYKDHKE